MSTFVNALPANLSTGAESFMTRTPIWLFSVAIALLNAVKETGARIIIGADGRPGAGVGLGAVAEEIVGGGFV